MILKLKLAAAYLTMIAVYKAEADKRNLTNVAHCVCRHTQPGDFNCKIDPDFKREIYAGYVFNKPPFPGAVNCFFKKEFTLHPSETVQVNDYASGVCNNDMNETHYITLSNHDDNSSSLTTDINTDRVKKGAPLSIITFPSSLMNSSAALPSENLQYNETAGTCSVILPNFS